jgi:hypothetical protein
VIQIAWTVGHTLRSSKSNHNNRNKSEWIVIKELAPRMLLVPLRYSDTGPFKAPVRSGDGATVFERSSVPNFFDVNDDDDDGLVYNSHGNPSGLP